MKKIRMVEIDKRFWARDDTIRDITIVTADKGSPFRVFVTRDDGTNTQFGFRTLEEAESRATQILSRIEERGPLNPEQIVRVWDGVYLLPSRVTALYAAQKTVTIMQGEDFRHIAVASEEEAIAGVDRIAALLRGEEEPDRKTVPETVSRETAVRLVHLAKLLDDEVPGSQTIRDFITSEGEKDPEFRDLARFVMALKRCLTEHPQEWI